MQTFLPYPDFTQSAQCLDRQRLGKQRVECLQILNAIAGNSKGWINHPCTRMWQQYPHALTYYTMAICIEWEGRGYKDTCLEKSRLLAYSQGWNLDTDDWSMPTWVGNSELHASHRSNLLRKMPDHYNQFGWTEPNNLEYLWIV